MTSDFIGKRLGDFEVIREVGRGGMGVVFEARQISLNRKVALKVLSGVSLSGNAVKRFHREAEAAAKLHHTNIVPVYATGEDSGIHFYAMELVDGPSLDQVVKHLASRIRMGGKIAASEEHTPVDLTPVSSKTSLHNVVLTGPYIDSPAAPLGLTPTPSGSGLTSGNIYFDTVAKMIADVADALDHAHKNMVIHRDIKPSNLLLSSDGRLSVNDFGLARMLEQPGMTMTGEFVGTPAYMSPEQIIAGRILIDHRTDIYSLGATLYELLTLQRPFTGERRDQILAQVVQKEPRPPRKINPKVPVDLETICLKCLEKDPDRRYQSGKDLADDLRRYVNRFAIMAKRVGPLGRMKKWVKRNPYLSLVGLMLLLATATTGYFAWQAHESDRLRAEEKQKQEEEAIADKRRAAIERGMVAALAADLAEADRAVAEAELLGASAGETRMLRGFIAIYAGKPTEAVSHLELAVQLMPERVAPRALLAVAYFEAGGNSQAGYRILNELQTTTATTPEDKLFKGQALATLHPAEGLLLMDEAMAERRSPLGHVFRARAWFRLAEDTGTVSAADNAVAAAEIAKQLLPDNHFTLSTSCNARLVAAAAYERAGNPARAAEHLAAARREDEELARFGLNPASVLYRFEIGLALDGLTGKLDRTAELRTLRAGRRDPLMTYFESLNWLCLGNDREAETVASEFPHDRLNAQALVLAALGRSGGMAAAMSALDGFAGKGSPWRNRLETAPLLLILDRERLAATVRDLRREEDPLSPQNRDARKWLLSFLEGTVSEAEFLTAPARGPVDLCSRLHSVGWKRLSEGNRDEARKAFEEAFRFNATDYQTWFVSAAVVIRMKDPNWPQAILGKK
jgi:serine/threonine protein kinase